MLKTLTLSLSLAVALGVCSVSKAGGLFHKEDGCSTCGIASPQGPVVSPQSPAPSPQGECGSPVCVGECVAKKKCHLFEGMNCLGNKMSCGFNDLCKKMKPKPKVYTYEWVLKKKRVWCHKGNPCGAPACDTCSGSVTPSGQEIASPQGGYTSPQAYGPAPTYSAGQTVYNAPVYGGSGQVAAAVGGLSAAPMVRGDEAPPAPEVAPAAAAPTAPLAPPAPPAPSTPPTTSGLLFSTPLGQLRPRPA